MTIQKSSIILEAELEELYASYRRQGINIDVISNAYKEYEKASTFLRRNKNNTNHPHTNKYKRLFESNKELAAKYKKIRNIKTKIKRKRKEEIQQINVDNPPIQRNQINIDSLQSRISINSNQRSIQMEQNHNVRSPSSQRTQHPQQSPSERSSESHDRHKCDNCHRRQFDIAEEQYRLHFHIVHSSIIRKKAVFKQVSAYTGRNACNYHLCQECFDYLVEKKDPSKCAWPSFLWILLSGKHKCIFDGELHFFEVYGGDVLWRFIPKTMRSWWIDAIMEIEGQNGVPYPYLRCTVDYPSSIFEDKTIDLKQYHEDYNSGKLARIVKAMNNQNVINRNVLCPWNCSVSCREAGRLPLDIMIQRMLPKVIIPLYSGSNKYILVQWSCNQYFLQYGNYPTIMLNENWPILPSVILDGDGLQVLSCKSHNGGQDKMTLFPPRSPNNHILNAGQSDQLAPCVQIPRVTKSIKPMKYCTKFGMVQCRSGYAGTCTMNLTNHSDFSKTSFLLSEHEAASIIGRNDIRMLLNQKVVNKEINSELAVAFVNNAKKRFTIDNLRQYTQGATYVRFEDMIRIHLFESSSSREIKIINDRPNQRLKEVWVNRSWPILINLLQTEDENGYGTQFRPIPQFQTKNNPSALTWSLFAMLSSCSELWHIIDTKPTPFKWSGWEGWILTSIQQLCFKFDSITIDKRSPITKLTSLESITSKVNAVASTDIDNDGNDDSCSFYMFNIDYFHRLFHQIDYSNSLALFSSIEDAIIPDGRFGINSKKIIITIGNETPSEGHRSVNDVEFELRVVCVIRAKEKGRHQCDYDAIRYMRHGKGFFGWWKQERKDEIVTQCVVAENLFEKIQYATDDCYFSQCVCVYVRRDDSCVNHWRTKFFESMGGKSHLRCQCCNFPLIPSHRPQSHKLICNKKDHICTNGIRHQTQHICQRKESYVCSNVSCNIRICKMCYDSFPVDGTTILIPFENEPEHQNDIINDSESNDNNAEETFYSVSDVIDEQDNEDENLSHSNLENDDDSFTDDLLVNTQQDYSLDITDDNIVNDQGLIFTNVGDNPINTVSNNNMTVVSGHVIFNQAGKCTTRHKETITGTSRERYMVQSLCASTPGQAFPLLQPEACLFPRHFYISAQHDDCSILGAQPLFLLCSKINPYGFSSMLTQARMHMTNTSSTTSTDPNFMCLYFDMLGNMVMNKCHSRDIFERGFVVDNKSAYGMSVRDQDHTKLNGSVDSRKMVLNLSASQKYVKYTWFLTFTANQKEHPGLAHLHEWKNSTEWTKKISGYEKLTTFEKKELQRAMEQEYGVHLYSNWTAVKYILLKHIKEHLTILGVVSTILARDEYQGDEGNLAHNHLIVAIDKRTMNGNTEKYIQDLIRTSVLELVKTDEDIERLMENGLLKSVDDVHDATARAGKILPHICDERCKMRVNVGEGDNDFRCRKMHAVRDCPDPTRHNYVPIPHKYQKATLDVLEEVGIYIPNEEDFMEGSFNHPYFSPKRHIAPCNYNAKCNMSPVIVDFFIALKSMQNAQALDHTNGLSKYVVKYISKFDDGNYVILCQDIHTGEWVLGKTHLHNTKIMTSKFNEDKAFANNRNKNHPRGRDMPHFEIRQILMGDPEVFTNLVFIQVPTLPFELRPTNTIRNDLQSSHPEDAFTAGIPMQQIRMQMNLSNEQFMSESQCATYRNHDGKASKYDMISIFSLRPPELLCVFRNPVDYFRYCHIEEKQMKEENIVSSLNTDVFHCSWIDCLSRRVRIRKLAIDDVSKMIQSNIDDLRNIESPSDEQLFAHEVNEAIIEMIHVYRIPETELNMNNTSWEQDVSDFFYSDETDNLPVPVVSGTSPENAQHFLIHIILSLGKYNTEIDALLHPTIRDSLREVGLIGHEIDQDSLKKYSAQLTSKYIKEQVVYYPNSLTKTETYIVMAKRVFDDAIIHNALSMNELPPFTMSRIRAVQNEAYDKFWTTTKESQLNSIFNTLRNMNNIPTRQQVIETTRESPLVWDPIQTFTQYENQSDASFAEQKDAVEWNVKQINKYRATDGQDSMVYTKNLIVYGAPGTGKSFVGQLTVLYAISQSLNIITTTLMGVLANALGGIHLHKLFKFPINAGASVSPFRIAELAMQKIHCNPTLVHALLTLDALFLDEAGQTSAEQLASIDIILRKIRGSQIPFGGVLMLGTMDPSQLQPITQLPFLTSSLMLTCFMMFELKHSVRAHGDPDFQRLQAITRMNPFKLLTNNTIKNEFFQLAEKLTYVSDWSDNRIGPNMMRAFSRVRPAQEALKEYRESIKNQLNIDGTPFRVSISRDSQRTRGTNGEYTSASEQSIKSLNKELKEPSELVFFVGGIYECTINDPDGHFCQSQLAFMLDLPSQDTVDHFDAFPLWITPPGTHNIEFHSNNIPSREELVEAGWVEVRIGCAPEKLVPARYGIQTKRLQYSLKHIGAITINKAQGATLPLGLAVEISKEYSPWEGGQIVVALSRTNTSEMTIIVGEKDFAIQKMWELITIFDQWTQYSEHVLDIITVNKDNNNRNQHVFDYPEVYPFRLCDITLPQDTTGFVYFLVSKRDMNRVYIGQTMCLAQRFPQHNNGSGAQGTSDIQFRPWGVAAYICGLSHMNKIERMSLERRWKVLVEELRRRGQDSVFSWINAGSRIVEEYNSRDDVDECIRFVRCISSDVIDRHNHRHDDNIFN